MFWALMRLNACNNGCDLMEFYRVNDHMVKCLVTEEDMEQYDIKIEDFFSKNENALMFIQEVVKMAAREVDYKPSGMMTSLQIAPIPDKGIAIFLTEDEEVNADLALRLMKKVGVDIPEDVLKGVTNSSPDKRADFVKNLIKNLHNEAMKEMGITSDSAHNKPAGQNKVVDRNNPKQERISNLERKVFVFETIRDVIAYTNAVEMPEEIESSLYKDPKTGNFYMLLERKEVSVQTLAGVYLTAYEYGKFVSEKEEQEEYIKEHCECVIAENAIGKLKK